MIRRTLPLMLFAIVLFEACGQDNTAQTAIINPEGKTLEARVSPPAGYERVRAASGSFAEYLRGLPLKPDGSPVMLYDGRKKLRRGVYLAVVDLPIGKRDLHQCADAIMRLRAEYLWYSGRYDEIHFNFTNGFRVDYSKWRKGRRIRVKGNTTKWIDKYGPSNTYKDLWSYLQVIFSYAGTYSLSKELKTVRLQDMQPGDVFLQGGFPGHGVIVADMAVNKKTGKKVFLLLQSYMPAQELQLLANPRSSGSGPWYSLDFQGSLYTPEWEFTDQDLKRFP